MDRAPTHLAARASTKDVFPGASVVKLTTRSSCVVVTKKNRSVPLRFPYALEVNSTPGVTGQYDPCVIGLSGVCVGKVAPYTRRPHWYVIAMFVPDCVLALPSAPAPGNRTKPKNGCILYPAVVGRLPPFVRGTVAKS